MPPPIPSGPSCARRASHWAGKLHAAMGMVVTIFLALAAATFSYSIGQGGPVAGLIFFTILLIGAVIRIAGPKPE